MNKSLALLWEAYRSYQANAFFCWSANYPQNDPNYSQRLAKYERYWSQRANRVLKHIKRHPAYDKKYYGDYRHEY